jgi:DNA-binding CsgD family transcriptional regulator
MKHDRVKKRNTEMLTRREKEVALHIADGRTNREIASLLYISIQTVNTHRKRIFEKLGVHNIASLVQLILASDNLEH